MNFSGKVEGVFHKFEGFWRRLKGFVGIFRADLGMGKSRDLVLNSSQE